MGSECEIPMYNIIIQTIGTVILLVLFGCYTFLALRLPQLRKFPLSIFFHSILWLFIYEIVSLTEIILFFSSEKNAENPWILSFLVSVCNPMTLFYELCACHNLIEMHYNPISSSNASKMKIYHLFAVSLSSIVFIPDGVPNRTARAWERACSWRDSSTLVLLLKWGVGGGVFFASLLFVWFQIRKDKTPSSQSFYKRQFISMTVLGAECAVIETQGISGMTDDPAVHLIYNAIFCLTYPILIALVFTRLREPAILEYFRSIRRNPVTNQGRKFFLQDSESLIGLSAISEDNIFHLSINEQPPTSSFFLQFNEPVDPSPAEYLEIRKNYRKDYLSVILLSVAHSIFNQGSSRNPKRYKAFIDPSYIHSNLHVDMANELSCLVQSYWPERFCQFWRDGMNTGALEIVRSLMPQKNRKAVENFEISAGKSQAIMLKTHDDKFYLKTIEKNELKSMIKMIPDYCKHVSDTDSNSLLAKIAGVFTIKSFLKHPIHLILMENIHQAAIELVFQNYDLKGSSFDRKVSVSSMSTIPPRLVLKDGNFDEIEKTISINQEDHRRFEIELGRDLQFLLSQNVMDYSITLEKVATVEEPSDDPRLFRGRESVSYCMGVIDFGQRWNMKKKMENFAKKWFRGGRHQEISSVNPIDYARRMKDMVTEKFLSISN